MPRILLVDDDINVLRALGRLIHFLPREVLGGEAEVECYAQPEAALARAAVLDPFGLSAFFEQTRYWPVAERAVRPGPLTTSRLPTTFSEPFGCG